MIRRLHFLILTMLLAILPGCADLRNLEDVTLALMAGIDLSEKNELLFYVSSPVFSKDAKKKVEEYGVRADSIRQSTKRFDALVTALTVGGKIQLIVLGKRLLQHPDWFSLLDTLYRDGRMTVNSRVVVVDGPVHSVFHLNPADKPRLPLHLTQLLDTANRRNLTVKTTTQEFHRMMAEKGMTPSITEFKERNSVVEVMGTALLDHQGKYVTLLLPKDTILLQILIHKLQGEMTLTVPLPGQSDQQKVIRPRVSFFVKDVTRTVKTGYRDNRFRFDVELQMEISLAEQMFPVEPAKQYKKLEQLIEKQLAQKYADLIKQFQKQKVDPVGFGVYARAYQYKEWKKVQDDWPAAFAKAEVRVKPVISIKGIGITE